MKKNEPIKGELEFYSETGTEGGYWAFMDEKFMHIPSDSEKCAICNHYKQYVESYPEDYKGPCRPGEHQWELAYPNGVRSREGLHILKDGDELTIYNRENPEKQVWDGVISLQQYGLFTEHAHGWWIHADQIGIERETWARWFLREHPARLIPIERSKSP